MNVLEVRNLKKIYKNKIALNDISFDVEQGKIYSIIGHNGAGKTTLFLILSGLLEPTSGSINILDKNISNKKDLLFIKKKIGLCTEDLILYPYLTIDEIINFICGINNIKNCNIDEWIEALDLKQYKNYLISTLSTGLRKRVFLLATLITNPQILLLDEPFTALDPESMKIVKDLFKYLNLQGKTLLISSHEFRNIEDITDKCMILRQGDIIESDDLSILMKKYNLLNKYIINIKENRILGKQFQNIEGVYFKDDSIICNQHTFKEVMNLIIDNKISYNNIITEKPSLEELYFKANKLV